MSNNFSDPVYSINETFSKHQFKLASTPAFDDLGNMFLANGSCILALSAKTGLTIWKSCLPSGTRLSAPAVANGTLCIISETGNFYAR